MTFNDYYGNFKSCNTDNDCLSQSYYAFCGKALFNPENNFLNYDNILFSMI